MGSRTREQYPHSAKTDSEGSSVAWLILVFSGMLEAVWAVALSESNGFRRWRPTLLFFGALALSMAGLAYAMTDLPTGTSYAVWVGIGATLTVLWGVVSGRERASQARMLLLALLIGSIVGLRAVS